ncbi:SusE domain-containing protein [Mucilaginibacter sp.]
MKKLIISFLAFSVGLLMLASCTKNDPKVVSNGGTPGTLSASATTVVLVKANSADTTTKVITFTATASQYNFKASVSNALQIDSVGDNWKHPATIAFNVGSLTQGLSTSALNTALLQVVPGGVTSNVNVRVQYALSPEVASYSNAVSLTVTPYTLASYIYLVGALNGWSSSAPDSLVSTTSNGVYTGTFTFPAGAGNNQFLILPAKNFNNKYATNDPTTLVPSATVGYNVPNNFNAPGAGTYTITLNLNTLTIGFK